LAFDRPSLIVAGAIAIAAAVSLAGCGRKGGLDLPPSDTAPPPAPAASAAPNTLTPTTSFFSGESPSAAQSAAAAQANATKNGFDSQGNPVAPPGQQKTFFLDFLLK
jgi:predicted small lipoprotein YifL